jgi:hypothetical protein
MQTIIQLRGGLFLYFIGLLFSQNLFAQTTGDFQSAASGSWSAAGTWQRYSSGGVWQASGIGENNPGQVPGVGAASGNVTIQNTHTITLDITNATAIASLTIGQGASGILQFETVTNRTLTITGGLTIAVGAQFNVQNAGTQNGLIVVGGNLSNSGTINFRQTAARYTDLSISGSTISGNGVYSLRGLAIGNTITNSSTSIFNLYGDLSCNGALTCSAGTLNFQLGGAQNLNGSVNPTFNNFSTAINGTSVTMGGTLTGMTVNGTFTMSNTSTFDFGTSARTVDVIGNFTGITITMQGAGLAHVLNLSGGTNTCTTLNTTAGSGSIVEYKYAGDQTVFASANYRNLRFSGSGNRSLGAATTVNNNLTVSGGNTLYFGGAANTTTISGNILITGNTSFLLGYTAGGLKTINVTGNVQVDNGSTFSISANALVHALTFSGDLTVNGTFNMFTAAGQVGNVSFNRAGAQAINGTPTLIQFNNFITAGTTTLSANTALTIQGNVSLGAGTTLNSGSYTHTVTGNWTGNTTGTHSSTGTIQFNGAAQTIAGPTSFYNIELNGSNTKTFNAGTITVGNNFNITANNITATSIQTINIANDYTVSGNSAVITPSAVVTVSRDMNITGASTAFSPSAMFNISRDLNISGATTTLNPTAGFNITRNVNISGTPVILGGAINTTTISGNLLVTNSSTLTIGGTTAVKTINVTGNVQVDALSTINVGAFAAVHLLTISGNLIVNGTFQMVQTFPGNVCNVTFSGATSNTISGDDLTTCNFNTITVNKGASIANVIEATRVITMSSPTVAGNYLTLTNGTFKLSSASTLTPYYGAATICAGTGRLWLNNTSANVSCAGSGNTANPGVPTVTGTLQVTSGTFEYGSGNDRMVLTAGTSALIIDGANGTIKLYGGLDNNGTGALTISAGNFIIDCQRSNVGGDDFTAAAYLIDLRGTINFTGGKMTIVDPIAYGATGNGQTTLLLWSIAAPNFTGSTIQFGDGVSTSAGGSTDGFDIRTNNTGTYYLGDIIISNTTGTNRHVFLYDGPFYIGGNITINAGTANDLQFNGRSIYTRGNIVNNGIFTTSGAGSSLYMNGTTSQTISGSGVFTDGTAGRILNLTINNTSGANPAVDLQNNLAIATNGGSLTLTNGVLGSSNGSTMTFGAGVAATITTIRTNGSLTLTTAFNQIATTWHNFTYNAAASSIITGNELPGASGNIYTLTINNPNGVILNNGNTNITNSLTLTSGLLTLGNNDLFLGSGATIGGAPTATNMVVISGTGGLVKNFATGNTAQFTYPIGEITGVAEYTPIMLDFSANAIAGNVKATVTNLTHPALSPLPTDYMKRYWSISAPTLTTYTYQAAYTYTAADFTGTTESSLLLQKYNNTTPGWSSDPGSTINTGTHVITSSNTLSETTGTLNNNDFTAYFSDVYYWSKASGNWSGAAGVWEVSGSPTDPGIGNGTPTSVAPTNLNNKGITIRNGNNITVNVASNADQLTIDNGGTLTLGANLTLYNGAGSDLTIAPTGTFTAAAFQLMAFDPSVVIDINGTFQTTNANGFSGAVNTSIANTNSPTINLLSGSTVNYNLNGVQAITFAQNYKNLQISGGNTKTLQGATFVDENLTISAGTLELAANNITVTGTTSVFTTLNDNSATGTNTFGNVVLTGGTIQSNPTSLFSIGGTLTVTLGNGFLAQGDFTIGGLTTIDATRILTISSATGTKTFADITVNGTWTANVANPAITINGNLTVNTGAAFNAGSGLYTLAGTTKQINGTLAGALAIPSISVSGSYTNNLPNGLTVATALGGAGTFTQGTNALLNYGATDILVTNLVASASGNTINYNANAAQNIRAVAYYNVTTSVGNFTKTLTGTTTISNNLNINAGTLELAANDISVSGTTTVLTTLNDNNASGTNNLGNVVLTGGTIQSNPTSLFTIGTLTVSGVANGWLAQGDFTVNGLTTIDLGRTLTINSATGIKNFSDITVNGTWTNTAFNSPIGISGTLTVNVGATFNAGTGLYTFSGTGKSITGSLAGVLTIPNISIGSTCTNNMPNGLTISTSLAGAGTLTQGSNAVLNYSGNNANLTLNNLDASANGNTVNYSGAAQNIKVPTSTYYNLTVSAGNTKTVLATLDVSNNLTITNNTTLSSDFTVNVGNDLITSVGTNVLGGTVAASHAINITRDLNVTNILNIGNTASETKTITVGRNVVVNAGATMQQANLTAVHSLSIAGVLNNSGTLTFWQSASRTINVTFTNPTDMTFGGTAITIADVTFNNAAAPCTHSLGLVSTNFRGNTTIGQNNTLLLNGRTMVNYGNITVNSGGTLNVNDLSLLQFAGAGLSITNNGNFYINGSSGNLATVNASAVANRYFITNNSGSVFRARYFSIDYLTGVGIRINAGATIDDVSDNFSEGTFGTNCNSTQFIDASGANFTTNNPISAINTVFNAGPTYNVTRTSGTGAFSFSESSGAKAGEPYDNDNGNPGTLINWVYPSKFYFSNASGPAGLTTNWDKGFSGSGIHPASLTGSDLVFVICNGHNMTLDNGATMDVLQMQVGQGVSGSLSIGSGAAPVTLTIRDSLAIMNGASITAASNLNNQIKLWGNLNNHGTVNLQNGSNICNLEADGPSSQLSGNTSNLNDLNVPAGATLTTSTSTNIKGNVILLAGGTFNDGGQTNYVAGNWNVTGAGIYTGTGTVNFNGSFNQIIATAPPIVFNNVVFSGSSANILAAITANGSFTLTNSTSVIVSNVAINVAGDFTVDPSCSYSINSPTAVAVTTLNGALPQSLTINGTANFYRLTFSNVGVKTVLGNISASNLVTIASGTTVNGSGDHNFANGFQIDGTCGFTGSVTINAGNLTTSNASGITSLGSANLIISPTANVTLTPTLPALTITLNTNADVTVATNTANYFILSNAAQLVGSTGGTFSMQPNTYMSLQGTDNFPSSFGTDTLDALSNTYYVAAIPQTVSGGFYYGNLIVQQNTKTASGNIFIKGFLSFNNGINTTFDLNGHNLNIDGYGLNNSGNILYTNNSLTNILEASSGGTVSFIAPDANQTLNIATYRFHNLSFSLTNPTATRTKTITAGASVGINGDFNVTGGLASSQLIVDLASNGLSNVALGMTAPVNLLLDNFCQFNTQNTDFGPNFRSLFTGTKTYSDSSTVYYNRNGVQNLDPATYGNLAFAYTFNKTATGPMVIRGKIYVGTAGGTPVFVDGGFTHTVAGDWFLNNGNYTVSSATGKIILNGVDQNIGTNAQFGKLTINNTGTATVVNNTLTVLDSLNMLANSKLTTAYNVILQGHFVNSLNGSFTQTAGTTTFSSSARNQTITTNGTSYFNNLIISKPVFGFQTVTANSDLSINGNLTISNSQGILDIKHITLSLAGSLTVDLDTVANDTTFKTAGSTVIFNGSLAAQNIYNYNRRTLTFNNVEFSGGATKFLGWGNRLSPFGFVYSSPLKDTVIITGDFTNNGSTVNGSGGGLNSVVITVAKDWTNTGTFSHNRTVFFVGGNQLISSSQFNNVDFDGGVGGIKTLTGNLAIVGNLTINDGIIVNSSIYSISLGGDWINNLGTNAGQFLTTTGSVTFSGGNNQNIYSGTLIGPLSGKNFYNVNVNKTGGALYQRGDLVTLNDFTISGGTFQTNFGAGNYFDTYVGGNFSKAVGYAFNSNALDTFFLTATSGNKIFDMQPQTAFPLTLASMTNLVVNASGATYTNQNDFNLNNSLRVVGGSFILNSHQMFCATNPTNITLSGGTLQVDSAAVIQFNNNGSIVNNGGTLRIVGSVTRQAQIKKLAGNYNIIQNSGTLQAQYYNLDGAGAGAPLYGLVIAGGTIDPTNNLSNGSFTNGAFGANSSYIQLDGYTIASPITLSGVSFQNNGVTVPRPTYNVNRPTGSGTITFYDASGNLAGQTYERDNGVPGTLINWTFPPGQYWTNGTGNNLWNDPGNWSTNMVPDATTNVYLDHSTVVGAYNVIITGNDALSNRLTLDAQGGAAITLIAQGSKNLVISENLIIKTNTTLQLNDNTDTLKVAGIFNNQGGTFTHGNSTVILNGAAGNFTINTNGVGVGKNFYNLIIKGDVNSYYSLSGPMNLDGSLTVTTGTLDMTNGTNNMTILGDFNIDGSNGGLFKPSTTTITFGGAAQNINGSPFYILTTAGTGTKSVTANIGIANNLNIGAGTTLDGGTNTIYIEGNWNNSGAFSQTGLGTIIIDGTAAQAIDLAAGGNATTFNNLTLANGGVKTFNKSININGDFLVSSGCGNVNLQTNQLTGTAGKTFTIAGATTMQVRGANNFPTGFGTVSLSQNSTIQYIADIAQIIAVSNSWSYGNLNLARITNGVDNSKTCAAGNLTITSNLTINDVNTQLDMYSNRASMILTGTIAFPASGRQIIWKGTGYSPCALTHIGTADWIIDGDITTLNHLVLGGANWTFLGSNLNITGNLTIRTNVYLGMYAWFNPAIPYRLNGNYSDTLTIDNGGRLYNSMPAATDTAFAKNFYRYALASNSSVYLNSPNTVNQYIFTGNGITYGNLTFNNAKTVTSDGKATLEIKGFWDTGGSTYVDNGTDIKIAGAYAYVNNYAPSVGRTFTMNGNLNQNFYNQSTNAIQMENIVFSGTGNKIFGDGNDAITISGNLTIDATATVTSNRNITFTGSTWTNNGIMTITGGTIFFNGTGNQDINPGPTNAANYLNNVQFNNAGDKTFIGNGATVSGTFVINNTTPNVYMGNLTHTIKGNITSTLPSIWHTNNANLIFGGAGQIITTPDITAGSITCSGTGTKTMGSNWTINGDLTINSGVTLNTTAANNYSISLTGNWNNMGTFTPNAGLVTFDGTASPINITNNISNFYDINITPGAAVTYNLQSASTRFARTFTLGNNGTLVLNGKTLILGSNIAAGKLYTINGTLTVDAGAYLKFNNQTSQSAMNVNSGGRLNIIGANLSTIASISREVAGVAGAETQINILSGGTIAAQYYLIEYLQDAGLNLLSGAIIDAINNFSNGTWSNIRNVAGAYYLRLETDSYTGGNIDNISFNITGAPVAGVYNVSRTGGLLTQVITFNNVSGNLGTYQYESDAVMPANCSTGLLKWPCVLPATWTGVVSKNWHTAGNWSTLVVPDIFTDVTIPIAANNPVIAFDTAKCRNLLITNGTLVVDSGKVLYVKGDITIGTAANTAMLSVTDTSSIYAFGLWTRGNSGIFSAGRSTVHFVSSTGSTTITPQTSAFYNVQFNNLSTTFFISGSPVNINGNVTIVSGIVKPLNNNYTYNVAGNFFVNTGASFMPTAGAVTQGTVVLNKSGDQNITNAQFYNLTCSGTGNKIMQNGITINNSTIINANSTLRAETGCNINFRGNITVQTNGTFDDGGQNHNFYGLNWYGYGNYAGNGQMVFTRGTIQNIYGGKFGSIDIKNPIILRGDVTLTRDLLLEANINSLNLQTYQLSSTSGSNFIVQANSIILVTGANNFPSAFALYTLDPTSQVNYNAFINQSIAGVSYGTLTLTNANTKTLTGDIIIGGNLNFNNATLDVSNNNFSIAIAGNWNNNALISGTSGTFIPHLGEVVFNGSVAQNINLNSMAINPFYDVSINNTTAGAVAASAVNYSVQHNLNAVNGYYNNNGRTTFVGKDLYATNGSFIGGGTFYLNNQSGNANIRTNGSVFTNLTINGAIGATFTALDNITVQNNFNLLSGTFNGNGKTINLGDWINDAVSISGTYMVGSGGILGLGNGTTLTVNSGGSIEVVGSSTSSARVTQNASGGQYSFKVNGNIAAKYALFEYMNTNGINVGDAGTIDITNNFSYSTFTNGANNGVMLWVENTQDLVNPNYLVNVSFALVPGGTSNNVRKLVATNGVIEFYNATGPFSGSFYEQDPYNLIKWTGISTLTWNGSRSTNWRDSLNWTPNIGLPRVPTDSDNVVIAPAINQPVLTFTGQRAQNLTIRSAATLTFNTSAINDTDLYVNGDVLVNGTLRLNTTNDLISVTDNWIKGATGSIINNGNTVFVGGGGAKTINSGSNSFYNLVIGGTTNYVMGANTTVRNDFTISTNSNFDVSNNFNYSLNIGGNWSNSGNFFPRLGTINFNGASGTKTINNGASNFYNIDLNGSSITYNLAANTTVQHNINIYSGNTLDLNSNAFTYGDNIGVSDYINVYGTLNIGTGSILSMGSNSNIQVNSGGLLKILGNSSVVATVTGQTAAAAYGLDIANGGKIQAKYYLLQYIGANGVHLYPSAVIDTVYNFSEGTFSFGQNAGKYLWFDDINLNGRNDTIKNVVFNSPVAGTIYNVYRQSGTDQVVMADASGTYGDYNYEYDQAALPDANSGIVHWVSINTYTWTGAADRNWHNISNWSLLKVPDTSKFVIIPNVANLPIISDDTATAKKITTKASASLTIGRNLTVSQDLIYYGNLIATGSPEIIIGGTLTSSGGTFTPATSKVILTGSGGTKALTQGASSFYDLEIKGSTTYNLSANTTLLRTLTLTQGTLNSNGFDLTIGGGWNNTGGVFVSGTNTRKVTFNAASGTYNIAPSTSNFNNVVINSGNGTGNATFTLGTTTPGTITISNDLTLTKGTLDCSPDGGTTSNNLTISNRYSSSGGTLVGRSATISVGENWQISGSGSFTCNTSTVNMLATSGTKSIQPQTNPFYNLTLTGAATFRLSNNIIINNNLSIIAGVFDVSTNNYSVTISGNWTNNGSFTPYQGTVTFNGTNQSVSKASGETFYRITVNNTSLNQVTGNITVNNTLTMTSGIINSGTYKITLGTSAGNPGTLSYTAGHIIGKFERWITTLATTYNYPLGPNNSKNTFTIRPIAGLTAGSLIAEFIASDPGNSGGLPLEEGGDSILLHFTKGYWNLIAQNGFVCTNYNVSLLANYFSSGANIVNATSRIIKRTNNGAWSLDGTHVNTTITPTDTTCIRNSLNGISTLGTQFGIAASSCLGGSILADQQICRGSLPSTFTNSVSPSGGNNVFTYTWYYTNDMFAIAGDASWIAAPSSNADSYAHLTPIMAPTKFIRKITTSGCNAKYSNILSVTLYPVPVSGPLYRLPNQ